MKKLCMIYGNCQHTHLQNFLEQTDFINYFNLVKVKDVYLKDKSYLDDDTLSKID
ncbi:acetyltransferase, partial [Escherichia coli]|nr:acetyltransferase [Escherichia coli]